MGKNKIKYQSVFAITVIALANVAVIRGHEVVAKFSSAVAAGLCYQYESWQSSKEIMKPLKAMQNGVRYMPQVSPCAMFHYNKCRDSFCIPFACAATSNHPIQDGWRKHLRTNQSELGRSSLDLGSSTNIALDNNNSKRIETNPRFSSNVDTTKQKLKVEFPPKFITATNTKHIIQPRIGIKDAVYMKRNELDSKYSSQLKEGNYRGASIDTQDRIKIKKVNNENAARSLSPMLKRLHKNNKINSDLILIQHNV